MKVTSVEVREVNPPPGVLEAMTRQMSAERTRRAQVTEAEGQKSAAILAAEGEAQAAINLAEGTQKATILAAEGERQSAILNAEGYSSGLEKILAVAQTLDEKTMILAVPRHAEAGGDVGVDEDRRADGGARRPSPTRPRPRGASRPEAHGGLSGPRPRPLEVARRQLVLGPVEEPPRRVDSEAIGHPGHVLDRLEVRLLALAGELGVAFAG